METRFSQPHHTSATIGFEPEHPGIELLPFADRTEAGRLLAAELSAYARRDGVLVLALPRGGIPVAYEVAMALGVPLDIMMVGKMGLPEKPELAIGAMAAGGVRVENQDLIESLRVSPSELERIAENTFAELTRRERELRRERPAPKLEGSTVILIDDGLATGATMRAAVAAAKAQGAIDVIVAVPLAPDTTVEELRREADGVICLAIPEPFFAVSQFYSDFAQVRTDTAREFLERAWRAGLEPSRVNENDSGASA